MDEDARARLTRMLTTSRIAAIGTLRDGAPAVSQVPFVMLPDFSGFLIHVSRLAQHTRDILADARVGVLIAEPDQPEGNPLELARITIQTTAQEVPRDCAEWGTAAELYLNRLPEAEITFSLGDFAFFRLIPVKARYFAGFARTYNLTDISLKALANAP